MEKIMEKMEILILPINLEIDLDYEKVWNQGLNIFIKNKNGFVGCLISRKFWLFDCEKSKEAQLNLSKDFIEILYSIKNSKDLSLRLLKDYLKRKLPTKSYLEYSAHKTSEGILNQCSNIDDLKYYIEELKLNKNEYAKVIRYKRLNKKKLVDFTWIILKIQNHQEIKESFKKELNIYREIKKIINNAYREYSDLLDDIRSYHFEQSTNNNNSSNNQSYSSLQKEVGKTIFSKIEKHILETKNKFSSFRLIYLVPPRISLYQQTMNRFKNSFDEKQKAYLTHSKFDPNKEFPFILMANKPNFAAFHEILTMSATDPKCLYLIVQDECHWGMEKKSVLDQYLNNKLIINSPNVYLLYVSATPYNIEVLNKRIRISDQIIEWDEVAEREDQLKKENEKYMGLKKFLEIGKLRFSEQSEKCIQLVEKEHNFEHIFANAQYSIPEISIFIEYIATFLKSFLEMNIKNFDLNTYPLKKYITQETESIIKCLLDPESKNLVVLRMNNKEAAEELRKWIKKICKIFKANKQFQVILDINDGESFWKTLLESNEKIKQKINKNLNDLTYIDLINFSSLLILIEKGRMGDTFPSNFKYYDLRCRYNSECVSQTIYASLIQDLGRAFGYNERPKVFVSKKIYDYLGTNELKPHATLQKSTSVDSFENDENSDLELFYLWDIGKNHQFSNLSDDSLQMILNRRFLLHAHPQNGKTGAVMSAIEEFIKKYNQGFEGSNEIIKFNRLLYSLMNIPSESFHEKVHNDEVTNYKWIKMHCLLLERYQKWTGKKAYQISIDLINERLNRFETKSLIRIIDMGCGLSLIGEYFCKKENKLNSYFGYSIDSKKLILDFINIDHIKHPNYPEHLQLIEMNMKNLTEKFEPQSIDIIVFSASLWGVKNDIIQYIENARLTLKPNGYLIICDHLKNKIEKQSLKEIVQSEFGYSYDDDDNYFWVEGQPKYKKKIEFIGKKTSKKQRIR